MAMITCKECGKEISATAKICPNCGGRTAHGASIAQTKFLGAIFIVSAILGIVGAVLIFSNMETFFGRIGDLGDYPYWSDETQGKFWGFVWGVALTVVSMIVDLKIMRAINEIPGNGFTSDDTPSNTVTPGWTCTCGRRNANYVSTCTCGKNKREL